MPEEGSLHLQSSQQQKVRYGRSGDEYIKFLLPTAHTYVYNNVVVRRWHN